MLTPEKHTKKNAPPASIAFTSFDVLYIRVCALYSGHRSRYFLVGSKEVLAQNKWFLSKAKAEHVWPKARFFVQRAWMCSKSQDLWPKSEVVGSKKQKQSLKRRKGMDGV